MAEKDEKFAKDANPEVEALKESAEKYCAVDEYDKAIAELTRAVQIAPDDADLYKRRGDVHKDKAISIDSESEGADEIKTAEYTLAVEDYSTAIKLNPGDAEAYRARGWIYYFIDDDQKALADYNQAVSINPDTDSAYCYY